MTTRRKAAWVLTVLFVFVLLFSHLFVIAEADHECSGEDCPICEILAVVSCTIKELALIGAVAIVCAVLISAFAKVRNVGENTRSVSSLITLKVKLSN